ncbi:MAG: branched-chain amino acid ABC transporter permease [Patescibacteria group bacterium]
MEIILQLTVNSLIAAGTYLLIATGFNLIYGATKFVNMAHGSVAILGGYAFLFLAKNGFGLALSFMGAVLLAGVSGVIFNKLVFEKLRSRKTSNLVSFVASLGIFTVVQALLAILFSSQFQSPSFLKGNEKIFGLAGTAITATQLAIILTSLTVFIGVTLLLKKTNFGRAIRAVSDDIEVAKIIGINTDRLLNGVFFIGSALAGLAGALVALDIGLQPTLGLFFVLEGAIASIVGGIGNIYGGALGSLILGFAENFGVWKISSEWKTVIAFSVLIVFLIFRPRGLMNKK